MSILVRFLGIMFVFCNWFGKKGVQRVGLARMEVVMAEGEWEVEMNGETLFCRAHKRWASGCPLVHLDTLPR